MAEHTHGNMDIEEHEKTFAAFVRFAAWFAVACLVVLLLVALINA